MYDSLYINFTIYVNYFRNYIKLKMEAGIQAGIGIVAAGSTVGVFQSLGALGLGILGASALPIVAGTWAVVGTTVAIVKLFAWWYLYLFSFPYSLI